MYVSAVSARIGIVVQAPDATNAVRLIVQAERLGIPAAWMTTGAIQADALTIFAAAAVQTERILLGSAIIPTWPRNAVFIAQQAQALESIAPGRVRLGIGPSTDAAMRPFGVEYRKPLDHLREYLVVLRSLLHDGQVDFQGEFVRARARIARPVPMPVMASALQPAAFRLCGEVADGAISWVCPPSYLVREAMPALAKGARKAGRETPPLVAHVPVCVEEDPTRAREAVQRQIGAYGRFQFYNQMFARAGFPDAGEGYSEALVDALVPHGNEEQVADRLVELAGMGFGEVMAMPLVSGDNREGSLRRAYGAVADAASRIA